MSDTGFCSQFFLRSKCMEAYFRILNGALQSFVSSVANIKGAAVITPDGLLLASSLPASLNEDYIPRMSAVMLSLGKQVGTDLSKGIIEQVYVQGESDCLILRSCTHSAVLLVITNKTTRQGALTIEINQLAAQAKLILDAKLNAAA
jgi:uncharacterized protein